MIVFSQPWVSPVLLPILGVLAAVGTCADSCAQDRESNPVPRVERPNFSKSDWDGIYFENLFEQGLVGDRPQALASGETAPTSNAQSASVGDMPTVNGSIWNQLISSSTIEDEVKSIQNQLATDITTPVRFRSDYLKAHRSFSVLSMLFAVIAQYDGDIRWKDEASRGQVAFWRAAANSRVGTIQAYESCKSRLELLNEMVRGGKFVGDDKAPDDLDWSNVADRNPLMHRLEQALGRLKTSTSNQGEFTRATAKVVHDSELIAVIALVLTQENMTDADDEGYREYADAMQKFAREVTQATKSNDFDAVSRAVNNISQSCDACHGDWR
jgi:cytochrome c556